VPRALSIHRTLVTPTDRERFHERLRERAAYYARQECRYWVFEEVGLKGAFLEFVEAADRATLAKAQAGAPDKLLDPNRVYVEVELT
jgi:hypothetical protein